MSQMLTVPAVIVVHLRQALLSDLGDAASEIHSGAEIVHADLHPERFKEHIEHFDRYHALLNTVGWARPANPQPQEIDLDKHGWALFMTLENLLEIERDLADPPPHMAGSGKRRPTAERHARELESFLNAITDRTTHTENLIVLLVLDDEHPEPWTHTEIQATLRNIPPLQVSAALAHLQAEGVLTHDDEQIEATRSTQHLDRLEMIAI